MLRYSPLGDLTLAASGSFYPDQAIPRIALAWAAPATRWLTITPAAALQVADRSPLAAGYLAATFHGRPGSLWIGGKYGRERRPVYLHVPTTFSVDGEIRWGLWGGGTINLPGRLHILLSYELHRIADLQGGDPGSAHLIALGLGWRSHGPTRQD
ncbi:MAG: hypothetical protein H6710_15230 [Myxococcales bacterium]|nr:hypothetical protein [Myxococcales bacterium]